MKGVVDDDLRALIEVSVCGEPDGEKSSVFAWIDTAFNGGLVLPRHEIDRLGLKEYSSTPAILADGQEVELPTFTCHVEWFGKEYRTQIVANEGAHPLLGTMLLDGHDLSVSYKRKTVDLI
ncbi:clan AA aspartic protease [Fuerstiella marisgermanici]|uniref:Clan AA aspartic protease, family n=1 Tax=Fuerstiella marisgermanici TaxID=1891926 RepID=A0A1P8WA38_9PLAN|nr:clan AA aspartic protease [Fuerstiella marisgermanici]APZ90926.1 clan AA aspartic protease, family [Fuerstiella marisgermanici]